MEASGGEGHLSSTIEKSSTWGDMVRAIDYEKKHLSWNPQIVKREKRIGHYDVSVHIVERTSILLLYRLSLSILLRLCLLQLCMTLCIRSFLIQVKHKEVEYNCITMKYSDPQRDALSTTIRDEKLLTRKQAEEDTLKNKYNIVTHTGPPRKYDTMIATKPEVAPPRKYNFFSNMLLEDHYRAPTLYTDDYAIPRAGKPKQPRPAVNRGEYNIINNYFFDNHDEKIIKEYERFKGNTIDRYWNTHDYDLIRGKFYDADKEQRFLEQRGVLTKVHGSAKNNKIPAAIRYSDGSAYDIVNHTVHDDLQLEFASTVADRKLHRMCKVEMDEKLKQEGELKHEEADKARLARIRFKRWEEGLDRGYDIVLNTLHSDNTAQPLPKKDLLLWDKLNANVRKHDSLNSSTTLGNSSSNSNQPMVTGRIRNLAGTGPAYTADNRDRADLSGAAGNNSQYMPPLSAPVSFNNNNKPSQQPNRAASASVMNPAASSNRTPSHIPSLDLSRAEAPEVVKYIEPKSGPNSMPVQMVRTGGLSAYRD